MGAFVEQIGAPSDELTWHRELFELIAKHAKQDENFLRELGITVSIEEESWSISFVGDDRFAPQVRKEVWLCRDEDTGLLLLSEKYGATIVDWSNSKEQALIDVIARVCENFELRPRSRHIRNED